MSTKRKLLLTICSFALVATVAVIGVFAFSSQTFSINNRIYFEDVITPVQLEVVADVSIKIENKYVEVFNTASAISFTENDETLNKSFAPPEMTFGGRGEDNAIIYTITVSNKNPVAALQYTMTDTTLATLQGVNETGVVQVSVSYIDSNNYEHFVELDSPQTVTIPKKDGGKESTGSFVIKYYMATESYDFNNEIDLSFQLMGVKA